MHSPPHRTCAQSSLLTVHAAPTPTDNTLLRSAFGLMSRAGREVRACPVPVEAGGKES